MSETDVNYVQLKIIALVNYCTVLHFAYPVPAHVLRKECERYMSREGVRESMIEYWDTDGALKKCFRGLASPSAI